MRLIEPTCPITQLPVSRPMRILNAPSLPLRDQLGVVSRILELADLDPNANDLQ
jgi:hypothetical protein